jgi:hypothetical protein
MKQYSKYDPEDIESLLLHKQFNELYPEEKEFVLRHLDGVEEYESMRRMLLELKNSEGTDEWLTPDPSIKKALMAEFARERKGRFSIWLNSLFAMPERPIYMQRGVQWSFGVALIAGAFFFLKPNGNQTLLAENQKTENQDGSSAKIDTIQKGAALAETPKTVVDTSMSNVIPAAPKVLAMAAPMPAAKKVDQVTIKESENAQYDEVSIAKTESMEDAVAVQAPVEDKDGVTTLSSNQANTTSTGNSVNFTTSASANIQTTTINAKSFELVAVVNTGSMANYNDLLDLMFTAK